MTDQRWDTWIDWDNANGAAMDFGRFEPGSVCYGRSPCENALSDVRHLERLLARAALQNIVLPIRGCGNDQ